MIVYEVQLSVQIGIEQEFRVWLNDHVQEMLQIDGFLKATIDEISEPVSEHTEFLCRYYLRSELDLFDYLELNAPRIRQDGIDRFGTQFKASRRIMRQIGQFENPNALQHPHQGEGSI
jgi:hypothetical protein